MPETPRHESSDIKVRTVSWAVTAIVLTVAAVSLVAWAVLRGFGARDMAGSSYTSNKQARYLTGAPQVALREFQAQKQAALEHYGWVDRERGIASIPIEQAMQELVRRAAPNESQVSPPVHSGGEDQDEGTL